MIVLLLLAAVWGQDCNNPMFAEKVHIPMSFPVYIPLLSSPATQESFGACQFLDGSASCCNSASFFSRGAGVYTSYLVSDTIISDIFYNITHGHAEDLVLDIAMILNKPLNQEQINLGVQMLEKWIPVMHTFLECYGAFVGYQQGVFCLACMPDWANYYDNFTQTLLVAESTCSSVYSSCSATVTKATPFLVEQLNFLLQILNAAASPNQTDIAIITHLINQFNSQSICQIYGGSEDCKHLICDVMMSGPEIGLSIFGSYYSLRSSPQHPNSLMLGITPLSELSSYTNQYQETGGLEAYMYGCESDLSGYACINYNTESSSTNSNAVVIAVVVLVIVFACAGGYAWLWWLRKPRAYPVDSAAAGYAPMSSDIQSGGS